jgi:PRC-barrel domain
MRAAELMGLPVYDADGELVGHVHDLRLDSSGKPGCAGYRLSALACSGKYAVGHRLGYGDEDMAGPWPLNRLFRRFAARARVVDWADVTAVTPERIEIARRRRDLRGAVEDEQ